MAGNPTFGLHTEIPVGKISADQWHGNEVPTVGITP
jgi:hypothetical protein